MADTDPGVVTEVQTSMSQFQSDLILAILEGLLFALILAFVAFLVDRALQFQKARLDRKLQIARDELPAMRTLWELTEAVRFSRSRPIKPEDLRKLKSDLTAWYYKNGNGVFLSSREQKFWRYARHLLDCETPSGQQIVKIQDTYSLLRTIIKRKLEIYDDTAATRDIRKAIEDGLTEAEAWVKEQRQNQTDR